MGAWSVRVYTRVRRIPVWDAHGRWRDVVAHEAGHAVVALRVGLRSDCVHMDSHGDFGWVGSVDGLHRPLPDAVVSDPDRLAEYGSVRAALFVAGTLHAVSRAFSCRVRSCTIVG